VFLVQLNSQKSTYLQQLFLKLLNACDSFFFATDASFRELSVLV